MEKYFSRDVLIGKLKDVSRCDSPASAGSSGQRPCKAGWGRDASVLILLVNRPEGQSVLLTKRTDHLRSHPGQISFPGGGREDGDLDAVACALRETEEEIGVSMDQVDVLGLLRCYKTGTGFLVTPVVAMIDPPFAVHPDPFEVSAVFEVPLSFLLDPANHHLETRKVKGKTNVFYTISYEGYDIWGATAGMLVELYRVLCVDGQEE